MKRVLVSLVIGVALYAVGVKDTFAAAIELYSTPLFNDANLVAYWKLENTSDSKLTHTLANVNAVAFNAAKFNNGADVGGANTTKYLHNNDGLLPATGGAFAVSYWFKNTVGWGGEWSATSGTYEAYAAINSTTGYIGFHTMDTGGTGDDSGYTPASYDNTIFHQMVLQAYQNGADYVKEIWVDGILCAQKTITGKTLQSLPSEFDIHRLVAEAAYGNGIIDDFAFFNRALTAAEINNLYNFNNPPTAFSLTAPSNNTSINNNKPTFSWGISTDPESQPITYTLKLSTNSGFDPVYRTVSSLSTTSCTPAGGQEINDGSYYWKVIASDGEMTTESTQTWQLTVDTHAPSVPVITIISSSSQSGKIIEIRGTGENGTTLTFYDKNGGTISGTTTWAGGNFTFTPTTPLDPGSTVSVTSEDAGGNTSQSDTHIITFEDVKNIFKDDTTFHGDPPGNSMRMEKDTSYDFNIAVNDGVAPEPDKPVTVKAYVQYNTEYGSAGKPKITLSGLGISGTETGQYDVAPVAAENGWEQLTVTGTPNAKGVVTLRVETFSTADGAAAWVDEISVSQ